MDKGFCSIECGSWVKAADNLTPWLTSAGVAAVRGDLYLLLEIPDWAVGDGAKPATDKQGSIDGLVYRNPAPAHLTVCKGPCPPRPRNALDNVLLEKDTTIPQLGAFSVFPLHNGLFENSTLDVAVAEDGTVTKLGVGRSNTAAASITAAGGNVDAIKSIIDAREKAREDAATKAVNKVTDDNKRIADCLDAQAKIVANGGTPVGKCE